MTLLIFGDNFRSRNAKNTHDTSFESYDTIFFDHKILDTIMVTHHMQNCFKYKKFHFHTQFSHGTQKLIFVSRNGWRTLSIFGEQSWDHELSNGVLDAFVAHL